MESIESFSKELIENEIKSEASWSTEEPNLSGLTKKQLKRQRKSQRFLEAKLLKKQKRRESKTASISLESSNGHESRSIVLDPVEREQALADRKARKEEQKRIFLESCRSNFSVIFDCSYEDLHTEQPLKSLCQQLMFCYGYNRSSSNPAELYITGLGPKTKQQLEKLQFHSWLGIKCVDQDFMDLSEFGINSEKSSTTDKKKTLIYLSSDAEETIETLDPNCAYIIGGIVDRNRYKGITHKKAIDLGIKTVKLPIKEHLLLSGTHILTINHVFEILLSFSKTKSWAQSLDEVLPQRKIPKSSEVANEEDRNCNIHSVQS